MISIVGLGNAASKIAEKFKQTSNYNVYFLNSSVERNSKYKFKLKSYETAEEYEENIPNLKKFFFPWKTRQRKRIEFYFFSQNIINTTSLIMCKEDTLRLILILWLVLYILMRCKLPSIATLVLNSFDYVASKYIKRFQHVNEKYQLKFSKKGKK